MHVQQRCFGVNMPFIPHLCNFITLPQQNVIIQCNKLWARLNMLQECGKTSSFCMTMGQSTAGFTTDLNLLNSLAPFSFQDHARGLFCHEIYCSLHKLTSPVSPDHQTLKTAQYKHHKPEWNARIAFVSQYLMCRTV